MFGSKLRSWMENHIVRPRKKGNKNKNQNSHDGYKKPSVAATGFTIYHGNGTTTTTATLPGSSSSASASSSMSTSQQAVATAAAAAAANHNGSGCHSSSSVISSPVRRREVSPIQSHSRYGWQSPDDELVTSPKSDNFLYAPQHHRVKNHNSSYHQRQQEPFAHCSTVPNSKDSSRADKFNAKETTTLQQHQKPHQQHPADCSSSSISSLSWSTGSKEPSSSMNSSGAANKQRKSQSSTTLDPGHQQQIQYSASNSSFINSSELRNLDEENMDEVHYEEIRTLLRHPENVFNNNNNNNFVEVVRPKSEQLVSSYATRRVFSEDHTQDDNSSRYGRLLPSKRDVFSSGGGSFDRLNANHVQMGSADSIHIHSTANMQSTAMKNQQYPVRLNNNNGNQRTRLRTSRFGGAALNPPANPTNPQPAGVPIHSLSSPESAYSTGYSTDGTSPGAIYTPPEYYINMRTGTHYFPKSVNSLAIEAQRYKFGLNKIEEMSPIEPSPKTTFESSVINQTIAEVPNYFAGEFEMPRPLPHTMSSGCRSPLANRNTIVMPTLKGFESPSPRQRCRIRTNPWYSTADSNPTSTSGTQPQQQQHNNNNKQHKYMPPTSSSSTISSSASSSKSMCSSTVMRMEIDAGSTSSSGIKCTNHAEVSNDRHMHNGKSAYNSESESSSSSLTEVENMQRTFSPNTIRRRRVDMMQPASEPVAASNGMLHYTQRPNVVSAAGSMRECQDTLLSDDDATLNEMMGKFDESYVYEKETDILSSDSDPTDCPSVDTGQDAEDECETDELLDIDFIDTSSIQDINDRREALQNFGSCSYFSSSPTRSLQQQHVEIKVSIRSRRNSRSLRVAQDRTSVGATSVSGGSQRRRKRFMKTRKKSSENRSEQPYSPSCHSRESRSVGGTPVCLRRNLAKGKESIYKTSPLSNRSSSLVFMHAKESRFMTIAESEKALLRADMEADVKYRQLIQEAESILVSLRNSTQSIPRETPQPSPRRLNPLANKRVEMLKNCDIEPKRQQPPKVPDANVAQMENAELAAAIHKRIELIKYESASAPNSPKFNRYSPRKTHLTNFINQNVPPDVPPRKPVTNTANYPKVTPRSPQLQLNGRRLEGASDSPRSRRRFSSQSPKLSRRPAVDSDSEQDFHVIKRSSSSSLQRQSGLVYSREDSVNHNYLPEMDKLLIYDEQDYDNRNVVPDRAETAGNNVAPASLTPYQLVSGGNAAANPFYCPQSEPLKRKVYKGSSTFERIKKSFDLESEIPKQKMLAKINTLRLRERQPSLKLSSAQSSSHDLNQLSGNDADDGNSGTAVTNKKQLIILSTIADLKRSLESQSVELNGLNED